MTRKDFQYAFYIIAEVSEIMNNNNKDVVPIIRDRCKQYKIPEVQDDIINLITKFN